MGKLVIIRHAESEWNLLGKWTGLTDVGLTDKGRADSVKMGELLRGVVPDAVYTSALKRTHQTLASVLEGSELSPENLPTIAATELNERDYGDLTGKDKWEVKEEIGDEAFMGIRRGWDYPVPGGETLKDVYARAVPYFEREILPRVQSGETVFLVAHGNSIRALMKHFDVVADEDVAKLEMPFGNIAIYTFDQSSNLPTNKELLQADITPTHA